ncbi:MAG: ATP-binding protein [archaeon]
MAIKEIGQGENVIGRSLGDIAKYGKEGTGYLGKVLMSSGEKPVLGSKILVDLAKPHLVLICGKRGGGKSYSLAVLLEEMARVSPAVKQRLSVIVIDTVGIFWSLKIPDKQNLEELAEWDLKPEATDVQVMVPKGKLEFYEKNKIPVDGAFTLKASELEASEWQALFKMDWAEPAAVLLSSTIEDLKETLGTYYGIPDIISMVKKNNEADANTKQAVINRLRAAESWGLIEKQGTKIRDIVRPGKITVIDVSAYRQAIGMEGTKDIIVALLGKRLFEDRMLFRKEEEMKLVKGEKRESSMPIVWMFIDEAHMFMPKDEENIALTVLLEWVRVGRQPGLSLVLATQRPEKLHPDAISQCDLFISHRMTAEPDIKAVGALRPNYMHQDFDRYYSEMPRSKGFALIIDDNTEKIWMVKIRPRLSWDAGVTASAFLT